MPASMYGQQIFSHGGQEATAHGVTSHAEMFERDVSETLLQSTVSYYCCGIPLTFASNVVVCGLYRSL